MSPTIDLSDSSPPSRWWPAFALWTAGALIYTTVLWLQLRLPFEYALRSGAVYVYSLALTTIPVRRWAVRAMSERRTIAVHAAKHIVFGLLTTAAWLGVNALYDRLAVGPNFWTLIYANNWLFQILFAVTAYGMVLGVTLAAASWRRERERERREAALTILTREAELGAIRAQFQPHFVLNALNSLLALIDADPALARTMVVRLADVMKAVFDRVGEAAVPLERELDLVKAYLDVERIRFGARLSVAFDIEDAARATMVPPLLLQPIVENAVKHGIAPYAAPGEVRISARLTDGRLHLEVRDTGTGLAAATMGTGQGLLLTRRRLETVYAGGYELTLNRQADGTVVRITLPADNAHGA